MKQVSLRKWQDKDIEALKDLCKDTSLKPYWPHQLPYPYTIKKAMLCVRFFQCANPLRYAIYAICDHDEVCGYIECKVTGHDCAELIYWLHKQYRHKGIMKEAVKLMCRYAFLALPIQTIYARVSMKHIASQTILLQNRFRECKDTAPIYLYFYHHITAS